METSASVPGAGTSAWRLGPVRELPVTHGGNPLNTPPPQTPPEGSGTAGFPAAALQVNARDHTNRVSRGGEEGFPPLRLLLHGSTPKQPGEQPSLQSGLRKAVGLAELLGQ